MHYLNLISRRGNKCAKALVGKCSILFLTTILSLFAVGSNAQNITIGNQEGVSATKTAYDDCNSIFEISLSISNNYYFSFQIMEDGSMISSSNLKFEGDASGFRSDNAKNVIQPTEYTGSSTLYLNTRNGYPYVLTSEAPSLSDYLIKISGETTVQEGDAINLTSLICPTSTDYTYQWYENGTAITGQTSADLSNYTPTINNAEYKLEVSNDGTVVASKSIKVKTLGSNTRFTVGNWWGITTATSSAKELAGYCNSVYLITLNYKENDPQFAIKENNTEIGSDKISVDAGLSITSMLGGDQKTPGWKVPGQLSGTTEFFYLDARTTPYKLTKTLSDIDFIVAQITQTQGEENIQRGEKVSFEASVCGSVPTTEITYQWYKSINGGSSWTAIEGATSKALTDDEPDTDGSIYRVIVSDGTTEYNSNEIRIGFLPSSVKVNIDGANKINIVEYEVPNNTEVTIKAEAIEMADATYTIQYKTFGDSEWRDTTLAGGNGTWTYNSQENIEFQITATGISTATQKEESYKTIVLIRNIYQCDSNSAIDTLWFDDFGRFLSSTEYVAKDATGEEKTYSGNITNSQEESFPIVNFFAADPNFFVQKHDFASQDPLFGPYSGDCKADGYKHYNCWDEGECDGYRVQDGYYAILPNPDLSNCGKSAKDYWNGTDHTGNTNGGMLFVNCSGNSKNTVIYERDITINSDCDNVQLLFSAFISNAAITESSKPVNVRLDIFDENNNLIHSVSSGDIMPRNTGEKWSNLTFKFKSRGQKYKIQLTNNNEGGAENFGNDILIDDISITICYPNISLISDLNNKTKKKIETCQLDTVINLYAYNENGIKTYIDDPKYIFQYQKGNGVWNNLTGITSSDQTSIKLDSIDPRFHGETKFRTIVASSEEVINKINNGEELPVNCEQVYAIDSSFIVIFHYSGPMGPKIDTTGCVHEVMNLIGESSAKPRYEWVDADNGEVKSTEKEYSFTIDGSKDNYNLLFIGYEQLGCPDTQKVTVRKKEFVAFDAPESFIVCEYDSLVHLSNIVPVNAKFTWSINGTVDPSQTGSTFKIADGSPLKGNISVTGWVDGHCDSTRTISYEIFKKFDLALALTGEVTEGKLCFSENGEVKATATHTPESAKPSKYYWYRDNVLFGETDGNETTNIISENGKYEYKVIATDGICYAETSNAPSAIDSVSASKTVGLNLEPKDTIVCQGQPITFNVNVSNALDEVDITWSGIDVDGGEVTHTTNNFKDEFTITPSKRTAFTDMNTIKISVPDAICPGGFVERKINYYIHNNIDLSIEANDTYCLKDGDKIDLTANVDSGVPTKYVWYKNGEVVKTTTSNTSTVDIVNGKNEYKVVASDDVCKDKTSDMKAIEARNPIVLAIEPLDSAFCEGTTIRFRAKVKNALDSANVALTWTGDDIDGDITTNGHIASLDRTPAKLNTKTETRSIKISTPDEVCNAGVPATTETSYKIHNNINVAIDAKETYCLSGGEKIKLTAVVSTGEPTEYIWYKDGIKMTSTNTNVAEITIEDGNNKYTVEATDGTCANKTSEEKSIEARNPIEISLEPKDTVFCEGTAIDFKSTVKNALDKDNVIVTWSGDDVNAPTTTTGSNTSLLVTPIKSNNVTETRTISISTKDEVCGTSADPTSTTKYTIHNKIELSINAERTDNLFCLDQEAGDSIKLTANVTAGVPTKYEWFRNGVAIGTTEKIEDKFTISYGANSYTVKASDGVCNATTSTAKSIEARTKMVLKLTPDLQNICEGEFITFKADVDNELNDNTVVTWKGDDIATGTTTTGNETTYKMTTTKSGNKVEAGHTVITATDEVCKDNHPKDSVNYNVYKKIGIELLSNAEDNSRCMTADTATQRVKLTILVTKGDPSKFVWFDNETTNRKDTVRNVLLKEGSNNFYVLAIDNVCNKAGSEAKANNTVEVREPISLDLTLDKSTICVNTEVEASVIIKNTHDGSTTNIEWTPEGNPQPSANCGGGEGLDNLCDGTYTNNFDDLSAGMHDICVTAYASDSKICPASEICKTLSVQDSLKLFMRQDADKLCQRSDEAQYVNLYAGIHSGVPSSIIWSTGDTTKIESDTISIENILVRYASKIKVAPNKDSIYWAYGTDDVCKNSNKIYSDTIRVSNLLEVTMTADPTNVQMGDEVTLTAITTNDEHGDFSWYDAESGELLGTTEENTFKYRIEDNGIYKFYVSVDNHYCGDIASTKKRITVADYTVVPNIITPYNSNQKNNVFMGPKDDKPGYRVEIYNRYQQMVFEGENGWDGTYRGQLAEPGTYFYRVFMKDGRVFKGTVEVAKF